MRREHRALTRLALGSGLKGIPRALTSNPSASPAAGSGRPMLSRSLATPHNSRRRAPAAPPARRERHPQRSRQGEQLAGDAGRPPALVDFQLAMTLTKRGPLARALGHDDIRHLLKHKRSYLPERLTAREKRILATPSMISRLWMASGKQVYLFVTRKLFRWRDREGAGDRGVYSVGLFTSGVGGSGYCRRCPCPR